MWAPVSIDDKVDGRRAVSGFSIGLATLKISRSSVSALATDPLRMPSIVKVDWFCGRWPDFLLAI